MFVYFVEPQTSGDFFQSAIAFVEEQIVLSMLLSSSSFGGTDRPSGQSRDRVRDIDTWLEFASIK